MPFQFVNRTWRIVHREKKKIPHERSTINYKQSFSTNKRAFTLIELLVVISIIAILMAVATVSYTNAQEKGRDNRRKSDLKAVQQALELYFAQNGKYPNPASDGRITCNTGTNPPTQGDNDPINWASAFSCDPDGSSGSLGDITYMNPTPKDPTFSDGRQYFYQSPTTSSYKIYAKIENANDKDVQNAPPSCSSGAPVTSPTLGPPYYCVVNP